MTWKASSTRTAAGLIPYEDSDKPFVEVGVITTQYKPTPIAPAMPDWGPTVHESHEEGEFGYPLSEVIAEDLYWVWDDRAHNHMERALRLYAYYKRRIDFYREAALRYHMDQHSKDVREAKEKSDASIRPGGKRQLPRGIGVSVRKRARIWRRQ